MTALAEPFFICLLASMIWAPLVFIAAQRLHKNEAYADKLWPVALLIAALPAVAAPIAAALGVSLRTAPSAAPALMTPPPDISALVTTDAVVPVQTSAITFTSVFEAAAALYLYGFLMFLALGILRHIWFAYRIGYAIDMDHPKLEAEFETWRERTGVRRKPRYAFTDVVSSVCVHGYFRPTILMPEALLERVSENDATLMVAHEMAHIKRGDTALFAFCTAVKAVFWFNPFMQRIAAQANLAAEQAADALVIASGAERKHYARCFVEGLRFAANSRFAERELVPSFTPFDRRSRRERLDAILSGRSASGLTMKTRLGIAASMAAAAGLAFAQAALAVTPKPHDALTQAPVEGKIAKQFTQKTSVKLNPDAKQHTGVDIVASRGTLVRAAGAGKVVDATKRYRGQTAWGNVVVIDHGHGLVTRYAHLDNYVVAKGDKVKAGDPIGAVGSTGRTGGKSHLHFEVIQDGAPIDPRPVLAAEPMPAPKPIIEPLPEPVVKPIGKLTVAPPAPKALSSKLQNGAGKFKYATPPSAPNAPAFNTFDASDLKDVSEKFAEALDAMDIDVELKNLDFKVSAFEATGVKSMAFAFADTSTLADDMGHWGEESHDDKKDKKDAERALAEAEKERARAERERERMEAAVERELARAERERERAIAEAERTRERAEREMEIARQQYERGVQYRERTLEDEKELLKIREKAIRQAQKDLDKELAEIRRQQKALERAEKSKS